MMCLDTVWTPLSVLTIWCLLCIDHFAQKNPIISGASAKNDLQFKASYGSSPPCKHLWMFASTISISNPNLIGLFSLEHSKRDRENRIINCDLKLEKRHYKRNLIGRSSPHSHWSLSTVTVTWQKKPREQDHWLRFETGEQTLQMQ